MGAYAGTSTSTTTTIKAMYIYESRGNEIAIQVTTPTAGCSAGFWLASDVAEKNKNFAAYLLSAFHAGSNVYFGAYTDESWSGSTPGAYCKIHSLGLTK